MFAPQMSELPAVLAVLAILILLNALFAASEMSIATARRSRLQTRAEEGDKGAKQALILQDNPNRFLSTVQVGITFVGTLAAVFSGDRLEQPLSVLYKPWAGEWTRPAVLGTVVLGVAFAQLLLGELVPKRIGMRSADALASFFGRPMAFFAAVGRPAVWFLSGCTEIILWILRLHRIPEETVTQDDIRHMVHESAEHGEIQSQEEDLIHSVFDMGEKLVRHLRTPRTEVLGFDLDRALHEQLPELMESGYSRFPAYRGDLDHIEGVLLAKDLFRAYLGDEDADLAGLVRDPLVVPENTHAMSLLQLMQKSHQHLAVVVNEHGIFEGVASLEDLLEEIVGEIRDETDEELDPEVVVSGEGRWLVSGSIPIERLKEELEIGPLPHEDDGHYDTLAGLVLVLMGRIPTTGEEVEADGWLYRVVDMDGLRIDKIELSRLDSSARE